MTKNKCNRIFIPKDACYLCFSEGGEEYKNSADLGETVRGEQIFIDFDIDGRVMGIELVSDDKECQKGE